METQASLAGFAQSALMNLYDINAPNIFTFPPSNRNIEFSEITELFRDNTYGGICGLYHRHISLMDEEAPFAAKYNKNGQRWKKIELYDINSMYPSIYNENMLCGRGFYWKFNEKYFQKYLMNNNSISMESIIAIDLFNQKDIFINKNGERVRIINGWFRSEKKFGNYPVDGYCEGLYFKKHFKNVFKTFLKTF